jgi:two-component system sensor histidine kinase ChvG
LTAIVSATIVRPIRRLRAEAAALLDHRGRLTRRFQGLTRQDEIGDLARALDELTRRLDEHLRFVEAFSADVSHEFKNPLASIRTIGEMLGAVDDPAERDRFLGMLRRDVDRLERLLSGVREIVAIDAQLEREATTTVDVRELAMNVADAHRLRGSGRVTIDVRADSAVWVRAAPDRIAQVLDNLVDNAISFSPDAGTVTIHVTREMAICRVAVCDEGPGIPESHLTRIFERFFSYRPSGRAGMHNGLGLPIAKAIVEGYGGSIVAVNGSAGGACIEVRLPLIG